MSIAAPGDAPPIELSPSSKARRIGLMVAVAFFMEQMDATVLVTALPAITHAFGTDPLDGNLVLTAYLVSLAAFIPASGGLADRFGTRNVFCAAIALFTFASILCGLAANFETLVAARFLQGIGAAMMSPVGRLLVLRSVPKSEMIRAMSWVVLPAMIAPIIGPLVGGFLATFLSWRWIFYINVPIGILGVGMTWLYAREPERFRQDRIFDGVGALLLGLALSGIVIGVAALTHDLLSPAWAGALIVSGIVCGLGYVLHARREPAPIVDLALMRIPTFSIAMHAGLLFRIAIGALPFLLPVMLQVGLGMSAFESGAITCVAGLSGLAVKAATVPIFRFLGYRKVMMLNSVNCAFFLMLCAAFRPGWPVISIYGVVLLGGFVRSLQLNAFGTIAFADVTQSHLSSATSMHSINQQVSAVLGISLYSAILSLSVWYREGESPGPLDFSLVCIVLAGTSLLSAAMCARLDKDAGHELTRVRPAQEP